MSNLLTYSLYLGHLFQLLTPAGHRSLHSPEQIKAALNENWDDILEEYLNEKQDQKDHRSFQKVLELWIFVNALKDYLINKLLDSF